MTTAGDKAAARRVAAERNRVRRSERNLVMVEIPRAYRDWFKAYAAKDGTTLIVALNAALEMFMEAEGE